MKVRVLRFIGGSLHLWLSLMVLCVALAIQAWNPPFVEGLRNTAFDAFQRRHPRQGIPGPVRIVDIDDQSLERLGQWPWPRTRLAAMVEKLQALGPAVIAFDITFAEPDRLSPNALAPLWPDHPELAAILGTLPDHDRLFADALDQGGVVLGMMLKRREGTSRVSRPKASFVMPGGDIRHLIPTFPDAIANRPELDEAAEGIGVISLASGFDGVIRRLPILQARGGDLFLTLFAETLRVAQGVDQVVVESFPAPGGAPDAPALGVSRIIIGDLAIETGVNGEIWSHFAPLQADRYVPAWKLLDGQADPDLFTGHIVLVGSSAKGLMDLRNIPLGGVVPGVEIHAQLIEQLTQGSYLVRPSWGAGLSALLLILYWIALTLIQSRSGPLWAALSGLAVLAAIWWGAWRAFVDYQLLLDPLFPTLTALSIFLTLAVPRQIVGEAEKRWTRKAFSQYLAPAVVEAIVRDPSLLRLGGEQREMTVAFTDMAGFSRLSETLNPEELAAFLNRHLTGQCNIIHRHRGTIDKFEADAIIAFWNAPLPQEDHPVAACLACLDMQAHLRELRRRNPDPLVCGLPVRMGVNTGQMVVGNMGSQQRMDYTVIGDAVNLASRLEGANRFYRTDVLISGSVWEKARDAVEARQIDRALVMGKDKPVAVFQLLARKGESSEAQRALMAAYADGFSRYQDRDFDRAAAAFEKALGIDPGDGPSEVLLQRCRSFQTTPPPRDWDGLFQLDSK